jgi:hypothetical protein
MRRLSVSGTPRRKTPVVYSPVEVILLAVIGYFGIRAYVSASVGKSISQAFSGYRDILPNEYPPSPPGALNPLSRAAGQAARGLAVGDPPVAFDYGGKHYHADIVRSGSGQFVRIQVPV